MGRYLERLFVAALILLPSCGIRWVDTLPLPDGGVAIYVGAQSRLMGMSVVDRWQYDPKTGRTVLVQSDVSEPQPLDKTIKKIPLPLPIP